MRIDHLRYGIGAKERNRRLEGFIEHQHDQRACAAHQEIAERHNAGFRRGIAGEDRRDDRGAEIDAEHHDHGQFRMDEAARCERGQQNDGCNAGMEQPCHQCGQQIGGDRIARQIVDDHRQKFALA